MKGHTANRMGKTFQPKKEKNIKSLFISIISVYLFFVLLVIVHVAYYFGLNKNAYLG